MLIYRTLKFGNGANPDNFKGFFEHLYMKTYKKVFIHVHKRCKTFVHCVQTRFRPGRFYERALMSVGQNKLACKNIKRMVKDRRLQLGGRVNSSILKCS